MGIETTIFYFFLMELNADTVSQTVLRKNEANGGVAIISSYFSYPVLQTNLRNESKKEKEIKPPLVITLVSKRKISKDHSKI